MKKFLHLAAIAAAMFSSFCFTSCSDDDEPGGTVPSPAVKLEISGQATTTSVSFLLTPADADRAAWIILERTAAAPDAATVFAEGESVDTDKAQTVTATELNPGTAYTVYAVAAQGDVASAVAKLDVQTTKADGPSVALELVGTPTYNSVTFMLTPSGAENVVWLIQESTVEAPDAAKVLADGTSADADKASTLTAGELKEKTDYTIYAVAKKDDDVSAVVELKATTAAYDGMIQLKDIGKNHFTYHIAAADAATYMHTGILQQTYKNFIEATNTDEERNNAVRTLLNIYGFAGVGAKDFEARDLTTDPGGVRKWNVLAGMPYVAIVWQTENNQTVGEYEIVPFETEAPELLSLNINISVIEISAEDASFAVNPEPGIATFYSQIFPKDMFDDLKEKGGKDAIFEYMFVSSSRETDAGPSDWGSLVPLSDYVFALVGLDEQGDRTDLIEYPFTTPERSGVDTEDIPFNSSPAGSYFGKDKDMNGNDIYIYQFVLADCDVMQDSYGMFVPADGGAGNIFVCELYSASPANDGVRIPDGEYMIADDMSAESFSPDYTVGYSFDDEGEMTEIYFGGGSILLEDTGDGYFIGVELETEDEQLYGGIFEGEITLDDLSDPSPFSISHVKRIAQQPKQVVGMPVRR